MISTSNPGVRVASLPWVGIALVVAATALWAEIGSSIRLVHADMWTVVFWRATFSALAIVGFAAFRFGRRLPTEFLKLGRVGLGYAMASAVGTILFTVAIHNTSIADVAVIYATMPFLTVVIAWLWFRQKSNCLTLAASALAIIGVALTAGGASSIGALGGQAVAVAMTLMYAAQAVIMGERRALPVVPVVGLASLTAALVAVPMAHPFSLSPGELAVLAFSGILLGAVGDLLFACGTQRIPSTQAALLTTLDVPLSALFAWVVVGESPSRLTVAGGAIILLAVFGHSGLGWTFRARLDRRPIIHSAALEAVKPDALADLIAPKHLISSGPGYAAENDVFKSLMGSTQVFEGRPAMRMEKPAA
jgi:drug/metabolite transporter (DMT)-like permease